MLSIAKIRWFVLGACGAYTLTPIISFSQSRVEIDLSAQAVAAGEANGCQYRSAFRPVTGSLVDSMILRVTPDSTYTGSAVLPAPISISLGSAKIKDIARGDSMSRFAVGQAGLAERVVSIWRSNSTEPICYFQPLPYVRFTSEGNPFETHTDVMATGEISNALRTGTSDNEATGSLGFHHQSYTKPGGTAFYFPFGNFGSGTGWIHHVLRWFSYPVSGEDMRATIGVAGSNDVLSGNNKALFAEAVLAPTSAAHGNLGSVDIQYRPFKMYGDHQQVGLSARFVGTRSSWRPDTLSAPDTPGSGRTKTAVLMGLDLRAHWLVINHQASNDPNNLLVAFDFGYVLRTVNGDASRDPLFLQNALGTHRLVFNGIASGAYLTLRQVTGFADFLCLGCPPFSTNKYWFFGPLKRRTKLDALEGLQPRIGFKFDAPFVTIR
jgi:hypothetical protein